MRCAQERRQLISELSSRSDFPGPQFFSAVVDQRFQFQTKRVPTRVTLRGNLGTLATVITPLLLFYQFFSAAVKL